MAVVELIAATTTKAGLKVGRALDTGTYEKGIKVSDAEMKTLDIQGNEFHPEWKPSARVQPLIEAVNLAVFLRPRRSAEPPGNAAASASALSLLSARGQIESREPRRPNCRATIWMNGSHRDCRGTK
jgi:hypothetical protein